MILLISLFTFCFSEPIITEVTDSPEHKILMSINSEKYFYTHQQIFVLKIFKQENPPGSASNKETHEVTNNFYFAISDNDDFARESLFKIGEFYAPQIEDVIEREEHIEVIIGYYENMQKKFKNVIVGHHTVVFK